MHDGRLPRHRVIELGYGSGIGQVCDACGAFIEPDQRMTVRICTEDWRTIRLHDDCFRSGTPSARWPSGTPARERRASRARRALGADQGHRATHQLQETGPLEVALDLVAPRADLALGRAGRELSPGDVVERGAQEATADVHPELLANRRVAQILLPEPAQLLVEIVAVRLGAVRSEPDAEAREGGLHLVEHLPRAAIRTPAVREIEIRERLGDRAQRGLVRRSGALPVGAVVHRQYTAVRERALGEIGHVRVAPAIEMREEPGEDPQHEIGRQVQRVLPLAALETREPLCGGARSARPARARSALAALPRSTLPRCHAPTPSLSRAVDLAISASTTRACAILFANAAPPHEIGGGAPMALTSPPDRFLFIVSRGNTKLATYLQGHFAGDTTVQVVVDRRHGERRQQTAEVAAERRRADRRSRPHVDKELRLTSFAIVTLPAPALPSSRP